MENIRMMFKLLFGSTCSVLGHFSKQCLGCVSHFCPALHFGSQAIVAQGSRQFCRARSAISSSQAGRECRRWTQTLEGAKGTWLRQPVPVSLVKVIDHLANKITFNGMGGDVHKNQVEPMETAENIAIVTKCLTKVID